jgi:RHS repeat-associated protein
MSPLRVDSPNPNGIESFSQGFGRLSDLPWEPAPPAPRNSDGVASATAWAFADQLGSVTAWGTFNGTAWSLQHQLFDAFGNLERSTLPLNPAAAPLPQIWAGHQFDPRLGLYHMQARWYDPHTGRFIAPDPIGFHAGDENLYRYVGNDPTNGVDPTGQAVTSIVGRLTRKGYQGLKDLIKREGLSALFHVHHKIGLQFFDHGTYGPWLRKLGFLEDDLQNVIALPTKQLRNKRRGAENKSSERATADGTRPRMSRISCGRGWTGCIRSTTHRWHDLARRGPYKTHNKGRSNCKRNSKKACATARLRSNIGMILTRSRKAALCRSVGCS